MKLTAEEFIDEVNGHNSWQHYPPSKQKVIGWLKQFAEMQVEAINYSHCCTELNHDFKKGDDVWITSKTLVTIVDFTECGKMVQVEDGCDYYLVDIDEIKKVV